MQYISCVALDANQARGHLRPERHNCQSNWGACPRPVVQVKEQFFERSPLLSDQV